LLLGVSAVTAQEGAAYQLRVPTAAEYLAALPHIFDVGNAIINSENASRYFDDSLLSSMIDEMRWRYPDLPEVDPALLYDAFYHVVGITGPLYDDTPEFFGEAITLVLLAHADGEFAPGDLLSIEEFTVSITPRDFDGDHQDELILQAQSEHYARHLVARRTGESYEFVESPLPWFFSDAYRSSIHAGFMEELYFGDITGNDIPEWVLALGGVGGNNQAYGYLYILQWQDGEFVDLAPRDYELEDGQWMSYSAPAGGGSRNFLFPFGVEVDFADIDDNGTVDILINQEQQDNWGCTWQYQRTFSFTGEGFALADAQRNYNAVQGCDIRSAEEAMWAGDIELAITHYENALQFPPPEQSLSGSAYERRGYAQARLAIAYSLAGRAEQAADAIAGLIPDEAYSQTLNDLIQAIQYNLGDPVQVCQAAYDVFNFECAPGTDACLGSPLKINQVGVTVDNFDSSNRNVFPSPARAGCDPAVPLHSQLTAVDLSTDITPPEHLTALGYAVLDAQQFDLNQDGQPEWLVWVEAPVPGIFFYPDGNTYDFSYSLQPFGVPFYSPYETTDVNPYYAPDLSYQTVFTPEHDAQWLIVSGEKRYGTPYSFYCPAVTHEDSSHSVGSAQPVFTIFDIRDHQLVMQQQIPFCAEAGLADIMDTGGQMMLQELTAWAPVQNDSDNVIPAVYVWNTDTGQYDITVLPVEDAPVEESDEPTVIELFRSGNYASALHRFETYMNMSEVNSHILHYYYAMTLEALDRPEEALAEYVTIYEAAPDSAWGILAALHLEPISQ
jgi:tetratricopeptide (TPR) repeat protein